jgi:hypothetical protein
MLNSPSDTFDFIPETPIRDLDDVVKYHIFKC